MNVYKIIAIIVLIPCDDDDDENGNQMAVSLAKITGGREGRETEEEHRDGKAARVAGRMKY